MPPEAFIGQWGAELLFDRTLRGIPGERIIEIDALGREIKLLQENPPVKGEDLNLSIDINLQKAAEEAFAGRAGAVVALKPDTGEILGLVSRPSFDPNLFARGINYSQWTALLQDKKCLCLTGRSRASIRRGQHSRLSRQLQRSMKE